MGRPKGKKNKMKAEVKEVKQPEKVKEVVKPRLEAATKYENWSPKPDFPKSEKDFKCACGHAQDLHYGPHKDWCNAAGCGCQSFLRG